MKSHAYPKWMQPFRSGHVKIQTRAYELYLERGDGPGSEFDDWLKAEWEIDSE
jgi:hypothetical protein